MGTSPEKIANQQLPSEKKRKGKTGEKYQINES